jgi:tetratricopeptide (TPR) repeat protein
MKFLCRFLILFIPCFLLGQENNYNDIIKEFQKGNAREAIKICETRIKQNPNDPKLYGYLSYAYYISSQRRTPEIDKEALRLRGIKKGQSYLFKENESMKDFMKVRISFNMDTLNLSEQAMLKAISMQKNNIDFMISLGEIYFAQSEHKKLLHFIDSLCSRYPEKPIANAVSRFGIGYFNRKEYDKALDIYKIILTHYNKHLNAYTDAAASYLMSGNPDDALVLLQQALKMNPKDSITLEYLSQANIFLLKNEVAAYYKTQLLESDTANVNILRDMAFITFPFDQESSLGYFEKYIQMAGEKDDQKNILQLAQEIAGDLKNHKDDILVNTMRSEKLNNMGFVNYSLSMLSKVLEKDKLNSPAYFDLATLYRDLNMLNLAIKNFSMCEDLTQDLNKTRDILTIVYYEKAKTYYLMHDYNNVIKYVKLSIEKFNKDSGELRYILGLAYLNNGDKDAAKKEFNTAVKMADDKKIVEQAKFELESLK